MYNNFFNKILDKTNIDFFSSAKNYLIAELLVKSLSLLSLPILLRLLEPSDYGILKIYESTISFFISLSGLALPIAIKRYFYDKKSDFKIYAGTTINFIILYNIFLFIIIFFLKNSIANFLNIPNTIVIFAFIIAFFSVFIRIYFDYLEANKFSKQYSISKIIHGVLLTLVSLFWIYNLLYDRYLGRVYSDFLISGLFVIYLFFYFKKHLYSFSFKIGQLKQALIFSLPIIPGIMSSFALTYFDSIIISQIKGTHQTGLYAMAYQLGMIIQMINISSLSAFQPIFFESMRKKNIEPLKLIMNNYSKFIYFCSSGLILFSLEIGMILSSESYHEALFIIPIIVLSYTVFFLYTVYFNYIVFTRKTYLSSISVIFIGIINIALNYILIPKFGYVAAAFTTLISYTIQFILIWIIVKRIIPEKKLILPFKIIIKYIYVIFISFSVFYTLYFYSDNLILNFGIKTVLMIVITFVLFKNTILKILKK